MENREEEEVEDGGGSERIEGEEVEDRGGSERIEERRWWRMEVEVRG